MELRFIGNPNVIVKTKKNIIFASPFKAEVMARGKFVQKDSAKNIKTSPRNSVFLLHDAEIVLNSEQEKKASTIELISAGLISLYEGRTQGK